MHDASRTTTLCVQPLHDGFCSETDFIWLDTAVSGTPLCDLQRHPLSNGFKGDAPNRAVVLRAVAG